MAKLIEKNVLTFVCSDCGRENFPYGRTAVPVPRAEIVKCQYCRAQTLCTWLDSYSQDDLQREQLTRALGFDPTQVGNKRVNHLQTGVNLMYDRMHKYEGQNESLKQKVAELESGIELIRKEMELEKKARQLLETELAHNRAFKDRWESLVVALEASIHLKNMQNLDRQSFQEENK